VEMTLEDDDGSEDIMLGVGYAGREARGGRGQRTQTPVAVVVDEGGEEEGEEAAAEEEASPEQEQSGAEEIEEEHVPEEVWQVCAGEAWEEGDLLIEEADDADLLHSRWRARRLAAHGLLARPLLSPCRPRLALPLLWACLHLLVHFRSLATRDCPAPCSAPLPALPSTTRVSL